MAGKVQIYTQAVPYHLFKIFPLFEQPDLKAKFQLNLYHQEKYVAVSNTELVTQKKELKIEYNDKLKNYLFIEDKEDGYMLSSFNQTKKISPYLFCFTVGEFIKYSN